MFFLVFILYFMTHQKTKKVQKELFTRHRFIKPIIVVDLCVGSPSHNF